MMDADDKDFQAKRIKTIEMLNPEFLRELKNCAAAVEMTFDEFMAVLNEAAADDDYYENMGSNDSYRDYDWDKIWAAWEILTSKKVPPSRWGGMRVPFNCAC